MANVVRIISFRDAEPFDRGSFGGFKFITAEEQLGFNAIQVEVDGQHGPTEMKKATRVYFIFDGSGEFTIDGKVHEVGDSTVIVIPPGSTYDYDGVMSMFEFNVEPNNDFT